MGSTIKSKKQLLNNIFAQIDDCSLSAKDKIECLNKVIEKVRKSK